MSQFNPRWSMAFAFSTEVDGKMAQARIEAIAIRRDLLVRSTIELMEVYYLLYIVGGEPIDKEAETELRDCCRDAAKSWVPIRVLDWISTLS